MTLAEKIRHARGEVGMKQHELADAIGVTDRAVRFWEAGDREPGFDSIVSIARVTGFPLDYFAKEVSA